MSSTKDPCPSPGPSAPITTPSPPREPSSPEASRRSLVTGLLGFAGFGVAASALSACASDPESTAESAGSENDLAESAAALTGTALRWADTTLGDLRANNSSQIGSAILVITKGRSSVGDGAGGAYFWESGVTTGDDGNSIIVPTTAPTGRWRRVHVGRAWVDTVLGTSPPAARTGDLATSNAGQLGGALVVIAKGCVTVNDGGGGVFVWDASSSTGDDGGTIIVPSSGGGRWVRLDTGPLNVLWFGAKADNVNNDGPAITAAFTKAASTGRAVFFPAAHPAYYVDKPIKVEWKAGSVQLVGKVFGEGPASTILGRSIAAGAAVLELVGSSGNTPAVNVSVSDLQIAQHSSCNIGSYCLKVGDANSGFLGERLWLQGANGVLMAIASSASYAQINTVFRQCFIQTNAGLAWANPETNGLALYAVGSQSGGASWDNVRFESCTFGGLVSTRATIVEFDNCQFTTNPVRGTTYGNNVEVLIGSAAFSSCYFEDHYAAIHVYPSLADVHRVDISDCYFSGNSNFGQSSSIGVYNHATANTIGAVSIRRSVFNDALYTVASVQNATVLRSLVIEDAVNISAGAVQSTPIRIAQNTRANFTSTSSAAPSPRRTEVLRFRGVTGGGAIDAAFVEGSAKVYSWLLAHECWLSRVSLMVDAMVPTSTPEVTVRVNRNGTTFLDLGFPSGFSPLTLVQSGAYPHTIGQRLNPAQFTVFQPADLLQPLLANASVLPVGTVFLIEMEIAY